MKTMRCRTTSEVGLSSGRSGRVWRLLLVGFHVTEYDSVHRKCVDQRCLLHERIKVRLLHAIHNRMAGLNTVPSRSKGAKTGIGKQNRMSDAAAFAAPIYSTGESPMFFASFVIFCKLAALISRISDSLTRSSSVVTVSRRSRWRASLKAVTRCESVPSERLQRFI